MEKAVRDEFFSDLIRSIERCRTELLEMMDEQQKAAEKQEEELIEELEREITSLKMRNAELEQLSHTEDHLHFLQVSQHLSDQRWCSICRDGQYFKYMNLKYVFKYYSECLFTLSANSPPCWLRLFTLTPPTNVWLGHSKLKAGSCWSSFSVA